MQKLRELLERIITRANMNLRVMDFDVGPYVRGTAQLEQFTKFCALCGLSPNHTLHFMFTDSSLAGSYFLDRCMVESSIIYKSDIRGDELKREGEIFETDGLMVLLYKDEQIHIRDSFLARTLVHNFSHDPNTPEEFLIQNTISMPYANIHGAPVAGSFLGAGSTVDLTTVQSSVIGEYAYVQADEVMNHFVQPGEIWIHAPGAFDFKYRYDPDVLKIYIHQAPGSTPTGKLVDFVRDPDHDFELVFESLRAEQPGVMPPWSALSPYAIIKGACRMDRNVFVSQRAYLEDAFMGQGSNAQENSYVINSTLEGFNVTAHGGKVINAQLGKKVFVGFNSFLRGPADAGLKVGKDSIIMPHTIIDIEAPMEIPEASLVWGCIRDKDDLALHSAPLSEIAETTSKYHKGGMIFHGSGSEFVHAFTHRIDHILEVNGAFFDGTGEKGHAQASQDISFNIIQPYPSGEWQGIYPSIDIRP